MSKHIIATTVLVEVDDVAWAGAFGLTREGAVEDSEAYIPAVIEGAVATQKAQELVLNVKTVDLLGWARKMQASKVTGPGDYYSGIEAERESWTDSLIAILTGEEDIDS